VRRKIVLILNGGKRLDFRSKRPAGPALSGSLWRELKYHAATGAKQTPDLAANQPEYATREFMNTAPLSW